MLKWSMISCLIMKVILPNMLKCQQVAFLTMQHEIRNKDVHDRLEEDLVEPFWIVKGNANSFYFLFQLLYELLYYDTFYTFMCLKL
jgi:hypothetical protein